MSEQDKRCGTCKWFTPRVTWKDMGQCEYPLPVWLTSAVASISGGDRWNDMCVDNAFSCPTWQPKEPT